MDFQVVLFLLLYILTLRNFRTRLFCSLGLNGRRRDVSSFPPDQKACSDYFIPFIEDGFEDFLARLKTDGEFAGNEAIYALAKSHQVEIYIHQE